LCSVSSLVISDSDIVHGVALLLIALAGLLLARCA